MSRLRNELVANNDKVNWYPETIKKGRFGNFLENVIDWGISRDRYWGTPLPVWECECGHHHVIGSIEELGMWDQNKALKLVWNSGNVWKTKINFNFSRTNSFEFKFIFISNGRVKQWEDGSNRKLIYEQLKEMVEPNIKEGYLVELKNVNGNNIIYNHKDSSLTVVCDWNKK